MSLKLSYATLGAEILGAAKTTALTENFRTLCTNIIFEKYGGAISRRF